LSADVPHSVERSNQREWTGEDDDDYDRGDREVRRRRPDHYEPHRGALILVLGILSIVLLVLGVILGPMAWVMGNNDLAAIRAGRMDPEGEGLTTAGRICGIIGTIFSSLALVCCLLYFLLIAAVVGLSGNPPPRRF